jgi:hypothetical protein
VREIRTASSELGWADRFGALKVRLNIGRHRYSVEPGLYRVGSPSHASPVLVTANYKLTFDTVRSQLAGLDVWLLVLDTKGINVWCAAGKGTFGTVELSRRIIETGLSDVVEHRTLVLPQLGAPGVAAHDVKAFTGFRLVYGPVRAADIPAFLSAGMKATEQMRRVTFTLWERFVLTGVELSVGWQLKTLAILAAVFVASGLSREGFSADAMLARGVTVLLAAYGGLLAGALLTPLLLPWLPFRAFSAKGALVGAVVGGAIAVVSAPYVGVLAAGAAGLATVVIASYAAMNYTGTSPITSPSGVELEMRRTLPWQVAGSALAVVGWIASGFLFVERVV